MAFDMGWNFRGSAGYVTDDAHYGVYVAGDAYPTTYTNGDGQSVNGGWTTSINSANRDSGNDPRIAGINYSLPTVEGIFRIDLASGSAPGAGLYTIDIALGDAGAASGTHAQDARIKDDSTTLTTLTASTNEDHFLDATTADVAATTNWTGATANQTFATTTCYVVMNPGGTNADFTTIAHFRLTFNAGATPTWVGPIVQMAHVPQRDPFLVWSKDR